MTLLLLSIAVRKHRPWFPEPEAECPEQPLALSHTQLDTPLIRNPVGESFPVPYVGVDSVLARRVPQNLRCNVELLRGQPGRSALPGRLSQASQPFCVEAVDPVLDRSRGISQKRCRFPGTQPLRNHQDCVKSMVIPGMLRSADLVLESQDHHISIFHFECSHVNTVSQHSPMRN